MIHKDRIRHLIAAPPRTGQYVLYWMQQAQRVEYNHALVHAIEIANELNLP
jgi:deoxyribodipyrimidine photo-lyase